MLDKLRGLTPVDKHISNLQRQIDDFWWDNNPDKDDLDLEYLQRELKYFLQLQHEGIVYEPNF